MIMSDAEERTRPADMFRQVVVVGAGNIGSHILPFLARGLCGQTLAVVDHDNYEMKNLTAQEIVPEDVGRNKAEVQCDRLRIIRPDLQVTAFARRIEDVPLGHVANSILVCATDSRSSRQVINRMATKMAVPWVDAAVDGPNCQLRINIYDPARSACLECGWSKADYAAVEQNYPCLDPGAASTQSPASLGAIAAGLAALEVGKLLRGERVVEARQLFFDVANWQQHVSRLLLNTNCRCDHSQLDIESPNIGIQAVVDGLRESYSSHAWLRVEGQRFARELRCVNCGEAGGSPTLVRALKALPHPPACGHCESPMTARGFDLADQLDLRSISGQLQLSELGISPNDILCLSNGEEERHFQLQHQQPQQQGASS